jgi:group I intron endonuclease
MKSYVYVIENKINGKLYVGKANNVERRWSKHRAAARDGADGLLYRAIRKHGVENFQIRIVDESEDEKLTLNVLEPKWIQQLKDDGHELYNLTEGGDGIPGLIHSDETRRKMSESQRGKKLTECTKQKLREANLGKSHSDETCKKLSEINRGKPKPPRSEEHCRKLGEAAQARGPMSEERKARISASMKESKNVGHSIDEETRSRIAEKLRGQVQSDETRAKRAESMRRAWERRRASQSQAPSEDHSSSATATT